MINLHRLAVYELHRIAALPTPTRQKPIDPPESAMRIKGLLCSAIPNSHSSHLHTELQPTAALILWHDSRSQHAM